MRAISKRKRSLKIVLLSAFALVVAAGAYFILCYPSAVPRFYQKTEAALPRNNAVGLPNEASTSLATATVQAEPSNPPGSSVPAEPPIQPADPATVPVRAVPTPQPELQPSVPLTPFESRDITGHSRHTVRSLLGLITSL